jgi:hypothetical protein
MGPGSFHIGSSAADMTLLVQIVKRNQAAFREVYDPG